MPYTNPATCPHAALLTPAASGKFSDPDVRLYVCAACGFPFLAAPTKKFSDNTEALAFFAKIAEEIRLNLPQIKPRKR